MSDFHNLQEENRRLMAENERLRGKILEMKVEISDASRATMIPAPDGIDRPMTFSDDRHMATPKEPVPAILDDEVAKLDGAIGHSDA